MMAVAACDGVQEVALRLYGDDGSPYGEEEEEGDAHRDHHMDPEDGTLS